MVLRRWGEYAFIRPGREMLFSRSTRRASTRPRTSSTWPCTASPTRSSRSSRSCSRPCGINGTARGAVHAPASRALWALNGWWLGRRHEKEKEQKSAASVGECPRQRSDELSSCARRNSGVLRSLGMPSSVIRSYRYDPAAAPARPRVRVGPPLSVSRRARGDLARDAAGVLQGGVLQREHPRPVPVHAGKLNVTRASTHLATAQPVRPRRLPALRACEEFISGERRGRRSRAHAQALPFKPFAFHGWFGKRETVSFGWRYDFNDSRVHEAPPIPRVPAAVARERRALRRRSQPRLSNRRWSSATTLVPASAGTATGRCSTRWSASRCCRPASCVSAAATEAGLPALRARCAAALGLSTAAGRSATSGSTASRPWK